MSTAKPLPDSVLFVCSLNSIRSPMAEALMKDMHGENVYVQSGGLEAGELNDLMVAVMGEKKLDLSGHSSKVLHDLGDTNFDVVICFTAEARDAAQAVFEDSDAQILFWPVPDPTAGAGDVRAMMDNFRAVRDNIAMRIRREFG